MSTPLNRRDFLRLGLMAQVMFFTDGCDEERTASLGDQRLARACLNPRQSQEVGKAYLATNPEHADAASLAAAIRRGHPGLFDVADKRLPAALREAVRRDFENDQIVVVGGWLLSRTESRLAAFVRLTS